jgi:hypothetical protein
MKKTAKKKYTKPAVRSSETLESQVLQTCTYVGNTGPPTPTCMLVG